MVRRFPVAQASPGRAVARSGCLWCVTGPHVRVWRFPERRSRLEAGPPARGLSRARIGRGLAGEATVLGRDVPAAARACRHTFTAWRRCVDVGPAADGLLNVTCKRSLRTGTAGMAYAPPIP